MTNRGIVLSVVAVLLAAVYVHFFTDWFSHESIQIIPQIRPGRQSQIPRPGDQSAVYPVSFAFDKKYSLTSIKVVSADELKTNKYANPVWHVVSESNTPPLRAVIYGQHIRGMKPAIEKARPEPLQPDVPYIVFIEAGKIKGKTNFFTREAVTPGG